MGTDSDGREVHAGGQQIDNRATPNLLIEQKSACRLDFLALAAGASSVDWLEGARLVRSRMPAIPTNYYHGKLVYGIRCDEPRFEKPSATFEQCEQMIQDIGSLTDRSPQIAHLWGWQYRGKDTGYPALAEVNPRIGGPERLRKLLANGRKYGCAVTFSDLLPARCRTHGFLCAQRTRALGAVASKLVGCEHCGRRALRGKGRAFCMPGR